MSVLPFAATPLPWWAVIGAPIANHLWQSTLFAAIAGLLTLLLRNNHASTRYSLWFLASMKFLLPFSLLTYVGNHLTWSRIPASTQPGLLFMMEEVGQPFATASADHAVAHFDAATPTLVARALPFLLLAVWFAGFAAVIYFWWSRWLRMTAVRRASVAEKSGREYETLRRLEKSAGIFGRVELIITKSILEPGILGALRPMLLLPSGISDRLTDGQLEAVMVHELCHVRRRDNLAAAFHMLVEALFWFHPLVWWLGARLMDERERACDEEVLSLGSDPQIYAESILKICEFYVESPLLCASGVTGSNLKQRIEVIMQNRIPRNLDFARKLLLSAAALIAVAIPLVFSLLHPAQIRAQSQLPETGKAGVSFETATVTPNTTGEPMAGFTIKMPTPVKGSPMHAVQFKVDRFMATNFTLLELIKLGYRVQQAQIVGGDDWLHSDRYDVDAKISSAELEKLHQLEAPQASQERQEMIQALLADRFKLGVHRESRQLPVYVLVTAPEILKMRLAKPDDTYPNGIKYPNGKPIVPGLLAPKSGEFVGQGTTVSRLVEALETLLDRPLLDKTGITGNYDFTLDWNPNPSAALQNASLFAALEQQLGLKIEEQESPVEVLVIDRAEKPSQIESRVDAPALAPR
jgi:bla regulator protein BlaR1